MIANIRVFVQTFSLLFLTYGGRLGVQLGYSLPCFSCPFVHGCAGSCFLMIMQRLGIFGIAFADRIFTYMGLKTILYSVLFILLVLLLSKMWCGWICPFGTLQDMLTALRKRIGIRELVFSESLLGKIKLIKYIFLAEILLVPLLVSYAGLSEDFRLFFCFICPARLLMPLFVGEANNFALDFTNNITMMISVTAVIFTAITVVGSFFKERFFCLVCPMLPLIQLFKRFSLIQFEKDVNTCSGCGNCQRVCPMDISAVSLEKEKSKVMTTECLLCLKCIEACPEDGTLTAKVGKYKIFSSSRDYILKKLKMGKKKNG